MAGPIRIAVLANASQARRELATVETRSERVAKVTAKAGKIAGAGLLALAVGAGFAAKAAAEDEAAQSKLAQTYRTAARATDAQITASEKWIAVQGKVLGIADDDLRPALGRLAAATGSVDKAQQLASLAFDVSAGTGKSLAQVSEALAKAHQGNIGALSRLGVRTRDASGKTLTLDKITKNLAKTYSGAASKAAETTAGKQRRLAVQMGELKEQIGAQLLPVMAKLADLGLKIADYTSRHSKAVTIAVAVLGTLAVVTYATSKAIAVYNAVQAIQAINAKRAAAGQRLLNLSLLANPVVLVVAAVVALVAGFVILYKRSEKVRDITNKVFDVLKKVGKFVGGLLLGYVKLQAKAWLTFGIVAIGALKSLLSAAFAVFGGILKAAEKGLGWIPGVGGKIKAARKAFENFGDGTIAVLNTVQGKLRDTRTAVDNLGEGKTKPKIDTTSIDGAQRKADKLLATLGKIGPAGAVGPAGPRRPATLPGTSIGPATRTLADFTTSGSQTVQFAATIRITADQLTQLQRGRAIRADLDAWDAAKEGRVAV